MNYTAVQNVINYIEQNYRIRITDEIISEITNLSPGYVRNEFKKVVGISLEDYRIRRTLSCVIAEIKLSGKSIKDSDIAPWTGLNSFYKAFKDKFGVSPMAFIKNFNEQELFPFFDIEKIKELHDEDTKLIEEIRVICNHGEIKTMEFFFSLKPYKSGGIWDALFLKSMGLISLLIRSAYDEINGNKFPGTSVSDVPKDFYDFHKNIITKYYDLNRYFTITASDDTFEDVSDLDFFPTKHFSVRESLINKLLSNVDITRIINKNTSPFRLITLWNYLANLKKDKPDTIFISNDAINMKNISFLQRVILRALMYQEQDVIFFDTMEELRSYIEYDYDTYIDVFAEECLHCPHKNKCDDDHDSGDDCIRIKEMTKEEKEKYLSKPRHKELTMDRLCEELIDLILERLIYFDVDLQQYNRIF